MNKYKRHTEISIEDEKELSEVFNRMYNVFLLVEDKATAKRLYQKTHFVSLVPVMKKSINDG